MIRIAPFLILSSLVLPRSASAQDETKASAVIDAIRASVLAGDFETTSSLFGEQFTMVHVMGKRFTQEWTRADWVEQVAKGQAERNIELISRTEDGPFVFDHYRISRDDFSTTTMFMYEVQDGRVVNIWHFDAPSVQRSMMEAAQ